MPDHPVTIYASPAAALHWETGRSRYPRTAFANSMAVPIEVTADQAGRHANGRISPGRTTAPGTCRPKHRHHTRTHAHTELIGAVVTDKPGHASPADTRGGVVGHTRTRQPYGHMGRGSYRHTRTRQPCGHTRSGGYIHTRTRQPRGHTGSGGYRQARTRRPCGHTVRGGYRHTPGHAGPADTR